MDSSRPQASRARPGWQLPKGVWTGTWDYLIEPTIATEYDSFHGDHPLMKLDVALLEQRLAGYIPTNTLVADFGCGTARIATRLEQLGFRTLNVDLSRAMLQTAASKIGPSDRCSFVHSNLVELDWLQRESVDVAVCLFSSIGMIRGRSHRQAFLKHVRRTLKPGGSLLLHVHNRGRSWLDPEGPRWLISGRFRSWLSKNWENGDRIYVYRGLPKMFLHIYSRSELLQDLATAGFKNVEILPIDVTGSRILERKSLFLGLLAGGYFAISRSTSDGDFTEDS